MCGCQIIVFEDIF